MKVMVEATGYLKQYIPEATVYNCDETVTVSRLKEQVGIPIRQAVGYVVNGKIAKADYRLSDQDHVKFIMLVGAG